MLRSQIVGCDETPQGNKGRSFIPDWPDPYPVHRGTVDGTGGWASDWPEVPVSLTTTFVRRSERLGVRTGNRFQGRGKMVVKVMAISPAKLKEDAIRLELLNAMRKAGRGIRKDFQSTTKTWKNKPEFKLTISLRSPGPTVTVTTMDEIYRYVDKGTKPHVIRPKKAKALRFQSIYTAKTTPNVLGSQKGGASGDFVFAQEVHHPGTKPRNFTNLIRDKWKQEYYDLMNTAISVGAQKSGHSMS